MAVDRFQCRVRVDGETIGAKAYNRAFLASVSVLCLLRVQYQGELP